jgi:hypothetical protein
MSDLTAKPTVSIVVPFHNEEDNITELYARLHSVMEDVDWEYQFVFVDDGSTDLTYKRLKDLAAIDPRVAVVRLRRNFGQTAALAAGFAHCKCDYVIAMDGDLQHDPAEIPGFLEKLEEGYDVVSGWRKHRVDNLLWRKIPSRCANWLMAKLSGVNIHDFGTTFKAYRRELLSQLPLYGEMHRFIPALASAYGASICEIPIHNKHSVSASLHVAAAALLWPARPDQHECGIRRGSLAAGVEGPLSNQCRGATRTAAGFCGSPGPAGPPVGGTRTSRRIGSLAVLQPVCAETIFRVRDF